MRIFSTQINTIYAKRIDKGKAKAERDLFSIRKDGNVFTLVSSTMIAQIKNPAIAIPLIISDANVVEMYVISMESSSVGFKHKIDYQSRACFHCIV
jgi:hypothetical protein